MKNDFDEILDRRGNGSLKWDEQYIQKRFQITDTQKIYPLFIADMDFCMDQGIQEKMLESLRNPDFGYFHVQDSFFESIVDWYQDIHQIHIQKEWIIPSMGTISTLHLLCDMLARDKGIVMMPPVYGPFSNCSHIGQSIEVPLLYENKRYHMDYQGLETQFQNHDVQVLLLCHPHNPGGIMWSRDELVKLVELCQKYHVIILVDEIHGDLRLNDHKFVSMIELSSLYDQIIVSTSPNKTFNISGLTTSFVLCQNEDLRQRFVQYLDRLHLSCNRLGLQMVETVYTYGKKWYRSLVEYIQSNMEMTKWYLEQNCIEYMKPDSGYLIWVRLDVEDVDKFVLDLAKQTHVLIETGARFVSHYQGWVRINVATSQHLLKEALELFVKYYQEYIKNNDEK